MRVLIAETTWTAMTAAAELAAAGLLVTRADDGTSLLDHAEAGQQDAISA